MQFFDKLFGNRFIQLDEVLGKPLTVIDLIHSGEMVVAVAFRRERTITLMRWGYKRFRDGDIRWFWPLIPGSVIPPNNWDTYGTNWQAYEIDLPEDVRDIAVRRRKPRPIPTRGGFTDWRITK